MPNQVLRVRRSETHFTIISNRLARDHRLSAKAKGLFASLASLPDGQEITVDDLVDFHHDGRDAIRSGFAELERVGYVRRIRDRDGGQFSGTTIKLYDVPVTTAGKTGAGKPGGGGSPTPTRPAPENPASAPYKRRTITKDYAAAPHTPQGDDCGDVDELTVETREDAAAKTSRPPEPPAVQEPVEAPKMARPMGAPKPYREELPAAARFDVDEFQQAFVKHTRRNIPHVLSALWIVQHWTPGEIFHALEATANAGASSPWPYFRRVLENVENTGKDPRVPKQAALHFPPPIFDKCEPGTPAPPCDEWACVLADLAALISPAAFASVSLLRLAGSTLIYPDELSAPQRIDAWTHGAKCLDLASGLLDRELTLNEPELG